MTEPHYLSTRANWEAAANADGARVEEAVANTLRSYLDATYPGVYEVSRHPTDFDQIYLEEDMRLHPDAYEKPAAPEAGDIWYNKEIGRFECQGKKNACAQKMGLIPDTKIRHLKTGLSYFIEAKQQNDSGNAHERACKYASPSILAAMQRKMGVTYHPVGYIFAGDLITKKKYQLELQLSFGFAAEHLFLWEKGLPPAALAAWFERVVKGLLD